MNNRCSFSVFYRPAVFVLAMAWYVLLLAGCASPSIDEGDSNLPWSTPQPWESAPSIPGLNDH